MNKFALALLLTLAACEDRPRLEHEELVPGTIEECRAQLVTEHERVERALALTIETKEMAERALKSAEICLDQRDGIADQYHECKDFERQCFQNLKKCQGGGK
jgi:hypothetical protein